MTRTSMPGAQIAADSEVPAITIVREFDAPPEKVFRAHADPQLFARWIGPSRLQARIDEFDCRSGGAYRYAMFAGDDRVAGFFGSFHEVRPGELIVQTFSYDGQPDGVALERARFEDLGNGRTRLTVTSLVGSFAERDAILRSGMEQGVVEGYQSLDELLGRLA